MTKTIGFQRALLASVLLAAGGVAARAQNLPDAPPPPPPTTEPTPPTHVPVPAVRPPDVESLNHRQWSGVVEPGEKIPPLTFRQKLLFPVHEEFRITTVFPLLASGAYGSLNNSDPKYGTNADDFGKRVGASALHQATSRLLSDSFLPILLHEDPRYYRQAYGTYGSRSEHAIRRVFLSQRDDGSRTFNFSDVLGRGMGAALTQAYYPDRSRNAPVVFRSWGVSLAALGGGNLFEEFWPDVKRKLFHKDR